MSGVFHSLKELNLSLFKFKKLFGQNKPTSKRRYVDLSMRSSVRIEGLRFEILRFEIFKDSYHYLLKISWPRFFGHLVVWFLSINCLFAGLYMLGGNCLGNVEVLTFPDAFYFSVQTMMTIGYGFIYPKTTYANVLVCIEAFISFCAVAMTNGLMFAKFSVPTSKVIFGNKAVIYKYNGKQSLRLRMANERGNSIVEARVGLVLLRTEVTLEGERMRRILDLKVDRDNSPFFALSWTVTHEIDESSPLFGLDCAEVEKDNMQVLVTLMGTDNTSGQTIHSRKMYNFSDLIWDHRLEDVILTDEKGQVYLDVSKFHEVRPV